MTPVIKTCCRCGVPKRLDQFWKGRGSCRDCESELKKEQYAARSPKKRACIIERARAYAVKNAPRIRELNRARRIGVSEDCLRARIAELTASQGGRCAICFEAFSKTPHVDHEHGSGKIRGLLCSRCNTALGLFKDSTERLFRAVEYLTDSWFQKAQ